MIQKSELLIEIGNNIRKIRNAKNISMQKLADYCDLNKSTIFRIEQGTLNPTFTTMIKISSYLKEPLEVFIPESERFQSEENSENLA